MQNKLTEKHSLLDSNGEVVETGWANSPLLDYNPKAVKKNFMRIKEWDSYIVLSDDGGYAVTFCFADNRYAGLVKASFIDIKNKTALISGRKSCYQGCFIANLYVG